MTQKTSYSKFNGDPLAPSTLLVVPFIVNAESSRKQTQLTVSSRTRTPVHTQLHQHTHTNTSTQRRCCETSLFFLWFLNSSFFFLNTDVCMNVLRLTEQYLSPRPCVARRKCSSYPRRCKRKRYESRVNGTPWFKASTMNIRSFPSARTKHSGRI